MKKAKCGRGSLAIEAVVSLTGFIVAIFTILNFINYCRVQSMVSSAIDSVAREMSQYAYFYEITGARRLEQKMRDAGKESENTINMVAGALDGLNGTFSRSANGVKNAAGGISEDLQAGNYASIAEQVKNLELGKSYAEIKGNAEIIGDELSAIADDPGAFIKSFAALAGSKITDYAKSRLIAAPLAKALTIKHFGGNAAEASERLAQLGVVDGLDGMNFGMSTLFAPNAPDDIEIVCYYQLEIFNPLGELGGLTEITLCKIARTRAWLGGDDPDREITGFDTDEPTKSPDKSPEKNPDQKPDQNPDKEPENKPDTEPAEPAFSAWQMTTSAQRGDYITTREKTLALAEGGYTSTRYFDIYRNAGGQNEFTQVMSIDPYSDAYRDDPSAAAGKVFERVSKADTDVRALDETITVTASDGSKTEVTSDPATRSVVVVVVLPENAAPGYEAVLAGELRKKMDGSELSVTVEYVRGYGNSPLGEAGA